MACRGIAKPNSGSTYFNFLYIADERKKKKVRSRGEYRGGMGGGEYSCKIDSGSHTVQQKATGLYAHAL